MRRSRNVPRAAWMIVCGAPLLCGGCGADEPAGAGPAGDQDVLVLNSTGQTLAAFTVGDTVRPAGAPLDLGAGFDGDAMDLDARYVVTSVSSFGGSRVIAVELETGRMANTAFPLPEGDLANPSTPSLDDSGTVWVGGRGSDAVYRLEPGDALAERVAEDVGTFIERVLPVQERLFAVDANLDDDGGSYQPLGPGRIVVLRRDGLLESVVTLPSGAVNPTDALHVDDELIVLASGSLAPDTFQPRADGALVVIGLETLSVEASLPLLGNGISLEPGADGLIYVTTTSDFLSTTVLRYDPARRRFSRGPGDPILVRDELGRPVSCWAVTATAAGELLCVTFSFAEAGRLVLAESDGSSRHEAPSGFGSTDLALR